MKKFLIESTLFIFTVFVCLLSIDYIVSCKIAQSNKSEYAGWYDIMNKQIDADIIVNGSSRALLFYSPDIFESNFHYETYNLGMNGACIDKQYFKYLMYRKFNKKPKYIIQNIDFSSLEFTNDDFNYQYFPFFYYDNIRQEVFKSNTFSFAEKYIPMYRYAHFGIRNMLKDFGPIYKGYYGVNAQWEDLYEEPELFFTVDNRTLDMFSQFLAEAKMEGIPVILVYAPIYYDVTDKIINKEEMYSIYDSLSRTFDVPMLDYSKDAICFDSKYFYDSRHLNKTGSELFTKKLCRDLDSMGIIKKNPN